VHYRSHPPGLVPQPGGHVKQKNAHVAEPTIVILYEPLTHRQLIGNPPEALHQHSARHSCGKNKTYNSGYSLLVTHPTSNPPVHCLYMAERTGSLIFSVLWSYMIECSGCVSQQRLNSRTIYHVVTQSRDAVWLLKCFTHSTSSSSVVQPLSDTATTQSRGRWWYQLAWCCLPDRITNGGRHQPDALIHSIAWLYNSSAAYCI
jgi:hypothetical protein